MARHTPKWLIAWQAIKQTSSKARESHPPWRGLIPIDVFFFSTADPATLLFTGAVTDEILQRVTPQFPENEFLQDDVNKFSWLVRSTTPINDSIERVQGKKDYLRP